MEITHQSTGQVVYLAIENSEDGEIYPFAFDSEEARDAWVDGAVDRWLKSEDNAGVVKEWLTLNPSYSIETSAYFVFVECSGIAYEMCASAIMRSAT